VAHRAHSPCAVAQAARAAAQVDSGMLRRHCACGRHTIGGATCPACSARAQEASRDHAVARRKDHGTTGCNDAGKLVPVVNDEHKVGNCVRVHEEAHASDPHLAEACRRLTKCKARDDGGIPAEQLDPFFPADMIGGMCVTTYNEWHTANSSNAELRAWSAEAACLRKTIAARCGEDKSKASTVGGAIGATTLGLGGAAGGAVAGVKVAEAASKGGGIGGLVAGGVIGGVLGAGAGVGLGWLLGSGLGGLTAGSQASAEDCQSVKGELTECEIAVKGYAGARPEPLPFEPDGRIVKRLTKGLTRPGAALPAGGNPVALGPDGVAMAAGRPARRSPMQHDFSAIRPHAALPPPPGDRPGRRWFEQGGAAP
jgi:hypothetical protein